LDQQAPERLIISLRGTDDTQEWIQDFKFKMVNYSPKDCCVEWGFSEIQTSLSVTSPENETEIALIDYLATQKQITEITVVGHSLGSSIATLTAFHTQPRFEKIDVTRLTLASPLTGDQNFVDSLQADIKNSVRIVNTPDLVPRTPLKEFGYRHIWHELVINSGSRKHIVDSIACHHSLNTYLHILNSSVPIASNCIAK
jgi:predicted lipase